MDLHNLSRHQNSGQFLYDFHQAKSTLTGSFDWLRDCYKLACVYILVIYLLSQSFSQRNGTVGLGMYNSLFKQKILLVLIIIHQCELHSFLYTFSFLHPSQWVASRILSEFHQDIKCQPLLIKLFLKARFSAMGGQRDSSDTMSFFFKIRLLKSLGRSLKLSSLIPGESKYLCQEQLFQ